MMMDGEKTNDVVVDSVAADECKVGDTIFVTTNDGNRTEYKVMFVRRVKRVGVITGLTKERDILTLRQVEP